MGLPLHQCRRSIGALETYTASYETTYHVMLLKPGTWVVDSVDANALGEVK